MAVARVVTFDGVTKDRMEEMNREMSEGEPPEGFPSAELIVLHDAGAEKSLVVVIFDTEDDYKSGDEILNAMPAGHGGRYETYDGAYGLHGRAADRAYIRRTAYWTSRF
jgi:hypothetical protein